LPETEFFLGQGLLFSDPEVQEMARANLPGCWAKRKLESARWLLVSGVAALKKAMDVPAFLRRREREKRIKDHLTEASQRLEQAADCKEGWGWAVNNGDIWVAQGAFEVMAAVLQVRLQNAALNPDADPDDTGRSPSGEAQPGIGTDALVTVGTFREVLDKAEALWESALNRKSSDRMGREFHPWQLFINLAIQLTASMRRSLGNSAYVDSLMKDLSDFGRFEAVYTEHAEMMMQHFSFPGRASTVQYVQAHEVVPWVAQTVALPAESHNQKRQEDL